VIRIAPRHRGAALLTAMLIVVLVSSLASAMVWRQYRAVQIEAADRARAQSAWILQGALDWARLILREDARNNAREPIDHLGEVWAVPLAEARLSTFLAAERGQGDDAGDGPEAFLSGSIEDAQSRYNLRHLLAGDEVPPLELRTLQRLCESAGLPSDTATTLARQLRAAHASDSADSPQAPLRPGRVEQLVWLGLARDTVERLLPLVTLLPVPTPVNLNTAPREVIAALFDGMDLAAAERLVRGRQGAPLKNVNEAQAFVPEGVEISAQRAAVQSDFFEVTGRLRLDDRLQEQRSLVQRRGLEVLVLQRRQLQRLLQTP
jgi:general secretion pathway protein K